MQSILTIEVVVAYENFAAGVRAKLILDRLSAALQPEFAINSSLWKFELLNHPQLAHQAAAEASKADMIVVSTCGDSDLPGHVKNWVESWLPKRRDGLAALIALFNHRSQETTDSSWPVHAYLRRVAGEGKMDFFFCKSSDWEEQQPGYAVKIPNRRGETVSPLAAVLDQDVVWREWASAAN